jgi:hypothetical protein
MCLEVKHMCSMPSVRGWKYGSAAIRSPISERAANKSNDDKKHGGSNAIARKLGRMTLPAPGLAHAVWT